MGLGDRLMADVQGDDGIAMYGRNDMHGILTVGSALSKMSAIIYHNLNEYT